MAVMSHQDEPAILGHRGDDDEVRQANAVEVIHQAPVRQPDVLLKNLDPWFSAEDARGGLDHPIAPARRVTAPDHGSCRALHSKAIILRNPPLLPIYGEVA